MASTDSRPIPIKNTAFRAVFPILDADGDLVTGATGLDSEVSKDQGAFADCTNEATEIATNSGMYYLDLTSTEMNADCVAVIVKTSSSGAKTTVLVFYPEETGDINVDVTAFGGTAATTSGGRPEVNTTHAAGTAWGSGAITAASIASDAVTAAALAADAVTEIQSGLATSAELAKVPKSDSNVTWNATAAAQIQSEAADALTAYDPPTRTEATSDKDAILAAVADVPTNAELAAALASADDAVLAAIAALNNLSAAAVNAEVDQAITDAALATASALSTAQTAITAIKAKTDSLTFTQAGHVDSNVQRVNDVALVGDGNATPWGPA